MKVTWLTQAGLLFENEKITVLVDPYLSDACEENGNRKNNRSNNDTDVYVVWKNVRC